jgi:hypothetical protein
VLSTRYTAATTLMRGIGSPVPVTNHHSWRGSMCHFRAKRTPTHSGDCRGWSSSSMEVSLFDHTFPPPHRMR